MPDSVFEAAIARHKIMRRFDKNHKMLVALCENNLCDCLEVVIKLELENVQAVTPQGVGSGLQ